PVPAVRHGLHEKLVQSGCNNVVVLPFALSDRTERGEFNFIPNLPEEGGLKRRHRYNAEPEAFIPVEVAVKRLDDMVPVGADIVFIKIDVEGAELAVLEGAQGILQKNRPVVAFECGAGSFLGYHDRPEDIWKLFDQLDYRIISITGEMMHTAEKFRKESHVQKFWDYIAIHKRDEQATKYLTGSS
ncbi:MAG: FkbM family methyltransferase, partial [Pseudomonadota bacterium]